MNQSAIQVFVSCESRKQAKTMVESLLNDQIVACGQIGPKVESFYRWQGQIERANECLLILKTQSQHYAAIERLIKDLHSYDTPEIIAIPITHGSTEYLKWINEQTQFRK